MCGIVGYVGDKDTLKVLLKGLERLEYRGYDSAGVAFIDNGALNVVKRKGRLSALNAELEGKDVRGVGIGHTRWATHGAPSELNAHPHTNSAGDLAIVHNGIIENYMELKSWLSERGVVFVSETDTETAVHLINYFYKGDLLKATLEAARMLEGSFALGIVSANEPDRLIAMRKDSPLVIGKGVGENLIASDIPAILDYTKDIYLLKDGEAAVIKKDEIEIYDKFGEKQFRDTITVDWDVSDAEKFGHEHFMIKEILEQPTVLGGMVKSCVKENDIVLEGVPEEFLVGLKKITIVGCGTASHAGFIGKYVFESVAGIPTEVDIASEYRYRGVIVGESELVILISQSGETADTLAALREAKRRGARTLAITNVKGSTITREADAVFYTVAGPEIAVASTKAYSTQVLSMYFLALKAARGRLSDERYARLTAELQFIGEKARQTLECKQVVQHLAAEFFMERSAFFIGRSLDYSLAMEASLKLKEVSYIHSEAYAAGELKHGTIALIEEGTLIVALATQSHIIEKTISNIKEVKARGAFSAVVTQKSMVEKLSHVADVIIAIPDTEDLFAPLLAVIPMQMFAYYTAVAKGCDVDKPRNLAKSVTVE